MKKFTLLAAVLLIITLTFFFSSELNRAGALSSKGKINTGSRFGVSIGMDHNQAVSDLKSKGLQIVSLTKKQSCHGQVFTDQHELSLLQDQSWRRGTICIASKAGKVSVVSWWFNWATP